MKVSDYVVSFLEKNGIDCVFGYIGGAITHLVDSIDKNPNVKFIQVYHEQTAGFAAEGFSRVTGSVGVAIATSGPGATNLVTCIGDAYFDSIPTLFITGQVNTYEYKGDKPIRQQGFQETDIVSMVLPITKYAVMVTKPEMIRYELEKSLFIASQGRPGPVVLDIPMDIQRAMIEPELLLSFPNPERSTYSLESTDIVTSLLMNAKRPLLLVGGGVINAHARSELLAFVETYQVPVVCSLMGKGAFPEDHPLFIGMIGSYGNRASNIIMANADLLIALGSRLDTRQTGTLLKSFMREGKIIHVDIDEAELEHNRIDRFLKVYCDAKEFLQRLLDKSNVMMERNSWLEYTAKTKAQYSQVYEISKNVKNTLPYQVMQILNQYAPDHADFFVDIGQNQMWAAQMLSIKKNQRFLTSGGMAPMGYSIPAAVGAAFGSNQARQIYSICGDGGFQISIQALLLISQYQLPIKVIVVNNQSLGMITQFQNLYFQSNKVGTIEEKGYLVPNIGMISKAYFLDYFCFDSESMQDKSALDKAFTNSRPALIEFKVGCVTTVSPKLEVNNPIEDVSPKLNRVELANAMLIDVYQEKQ